MGWLLDTLKEIPLSAVLKEKIAAIEDKYAAAETQNKILEGDLRKANAHITELTQENQRLKQQVEELTHKDDLDDLELQLLIAIANLNYDIAVPDTFGRGFDVSKARFEYHLQRLEDLGYVNGGMSDDYGTHYAVTQDGRVFLLKKNLL
jgi:chromosome segregation ATPase